jgi:hypothetical protein
MQMKLKPRNEPNHSTAPKLCSVLPGCDTVSLGEQLLSFQRPFHPKDEGSVVVRSVRHYSPDTASCKSSTPRFHGHDKAKVLTCQCQRMAQHSFAGSDTVPTCRSSALPPSSRQKNVSADKCNIQHISAHNFAFQNTVAFFITCQLTPLHKSHTPLPQTSHLVNLHHKLSLQVSAVTLCIVKLICLYVENCRARNRKVAANILNTETRTVHKGWSSSLGVGRGANNSSP